MCICCASVPMAVSLGAMATVKQKRGEHIPQWLLALPAERVTAVIIVGLLAGSVMYHSQIDPA
jgi:hypothetical protein